MTLNREDRMTDEEIEALRLMPFTISLNIGCGVYATEEEKNLNLLAMAHYNAKLRVIEELKRTRAELVKLRERDETLSALEAAGVDNWEGYSNAFSDDPDEDEEGADFYEEDEDPADILNAFHEHCEGYGFTARPHDGKE